MADHADTPPSRNPGMSGLAFVVGALVAVVAVVAYMVFSGEMPTAQDKGDVTITIDGAGDAARDAGNALQGAANAIEGAAKDATDGQ